MKRILTWAAAALAAACGGLAVFGWLASRDAPLPPDESEFAVARPGVAPEDNAFTYFLAATNHLVETTNAQLVADFLAGKAPDDPELRALAASNAACFAQIQRGTDCAVCQFPLPPSYFDAEFPYLSAWLKIGRLLAVRSRQARLDGRWAEAVVDAWAVARMGGIAADHAESMIHYLVGVAIAGEGYEQILALAADPAVPAADLQVLAAGLDQLGPYDAGLARALKMEADHAADLVAGFASGRVDWIDLLTFGEVERDFRKRLLAGLMRSPYFFRPQATLRAVREKYRQAIRDVSLPYAQADATEEPKFGQSLLQLLRPNSVGEFFRRVVVVPARQTLETKCRAESLLAGAKLAVACHRFERERGRFPETLAELVPEYLDALPRDPYDGAPFRYSTEKGQVWAVGKNLTDEGGSTRVPGADKEYVASRHRRRAEDFVFELRPAEAE
ncbi:MAG: hypothetical protein EOL90_08145 [Spartobacteria bacterium]|nr:hypothetical protein [Spartobacteria bacterium]